MIRYFIPFALVLSACTDTDSVGIECMQKQENGVWKVLSQEECDALLAGSMDTATDTAVDTADTGEDTATDTVPTVDCTTIEVDTVGGTKAWFGNNLIVGNAGITPEAHTSNQAYFTGFTVTSQYAECQPVAITEVPIEVPFTDNDVSGWQPTGFSILDETTRYVLMEGETAINEEGKLVGRLLGGLVMNPGDTETFIIVGDPTGAGTDDNIRVDVESGMKVYDGSKWVFLGNEEIQGGTYTND